MTKSKSLTYFIRFYANSLGKDLGYSGFIVEVVPSLEASLGASVEVIEASFIFILLDMLMRSKRL